METLVQDLRFGLRMLLKAPAVTGIAVLSLALGIGATTAVFSFVNAFFLRSVPVADPTRIALIYGTDAKKTGAVASWNYFPISDPNFKDLHDQAQSFSATASYTILPVNLAGESAPPERVWGQLVTGNYFDLLGVRALRGRTFRAEEDGAPGAHPVVVISHSLWRRRYGADPNLIGRSLLLSGRLFTVVGIAPPGFQGPSSVGGTEFWIPMPMRDQLLANPQNVRQRRWRQFFALGRLRPGVDLAQADLEVRTIGARLEQEFPADNEGRGFTVLPVGQAGVNPNERNGQLRAGMLLMGAVALVLMIACANVANLLLSRAVGRYQEISIRLAQGATRKRLVRQLLTESLLLFSAGGGLGLLVAVWTRTLLWQIRPPFFSVLDPTIDLSLDRRVLAFNLVLTLATGLLFGLVPAFQSLRQAPALYLKEGTAGSGHGQAGTRARNALVAGQIALSLIALVSAGLFVRSLQNFQHLEPGFETRNLLQLTISSDGNSYPESRVRDYQQRVIETVEALPGVRSASLASSRLMNGASVMMRTILRQGIEDATSKGGLLTRTDLVDPSYFGTAGIPLLQGRDFTASDTPGKPAVAILNEMAARRLWPGQPAVGQQFSIFGEHMNIEVVGVVSNIRAGTLANEPEPILYLPLRQRRVPGVSILVRNESAPEGSLLAVRQAVQKLDHDLPLVDVETISESLGASLWAPSTGAALFSAFGLLALIMAVIGLYGVTAHSLQERRREFAIRSALGASRGDVVYLVLQQTAKIVGVGLALGLVAALVFTRAIGSFLFGVRATDPATFGLIVLLLAGVSLAATLLPIGQATRVEVATVLRAT